MCHSLVIMGLYGLRESLLHFSGVDVATLFIANLVLSYAVAFAVHGLLEWPLQVLQGLIFAKKMGALGSCVSCRSRSHQA